MTNKTIKAARAEVKQAKQKFKQAIKQKGPNTKECLSNFIRTQTILRSEIRKENQTTLVTTLNKFLEEGGIKSQSFWKIREQISKGNKPTEYDLKTKEASLVMDETETKEYIANYFENLYLARESAEGYKATMAMISHRVLQTEDTPPHKTR